MPDIRITVRGGLAHAEGKPEIICGNSDYRAVFDLDGPWEMYEVRCARFVWRDLISGQMRYADVLFEGDTAEIPPFFNTDLVLAGVYAGNRLTSTPVPIVCRGCITENEPARSKPPADIYEQLNETVSTLLRNSYTVNVYNTALSVGAVRAFLCVGIFREFEQEVKA